MTGLNNNGKFVSSTPKTYTVVELRDQEVKKSPLSIAARSKVVNRSGSNYLSESQEGYGPCSAYNCRSCSCPRSDCNCEAGERYVKVFMNCPADGCGNREKTNWVHSNDSCYIGISNHANIRCEKSYCSATNKMQNWKFRCSNESFHKGQYSNASTETGIDVVTTAGKQGGDSDLILELLMYLHKPENRF